MGFRDYLPSFERPHQNQGHNTVSGNSPSYRRTQNNMFDKDVNSDDEEADYYSGNHEEDDDECDDNDDWYEYLEDDDDDCDNGDDSDDGSQWHILQVSNRGSETSKYRKKGPDEVTSNALPRLRFPWRRQRSQDRTNNPSKESPVFRSPSQNDSNETENDQNDSHLNEGSEGNDNGTDSNNNIEEYGEDKGSEPGNNESEYQEEWDDETEEEEPLEHIPPESNPSDEPEDNSPQKEIPVDPPKFPSSNNTSNQTRTEPIHTSAFMKESHPRLLRNSIGRKINHTQNKIRVSREGEEDGNFDIDSEEDDDDQEYNIDREAERQDPYRRSPPPPPRDPYRRRTMAREDQNRRRRQSPPPPRPNDYYYERKPRDRENPYRGRSREPDYPHYRGRGERNEMSGNRDQDGMFRDRQRELERQRDRDSQRDGGYADERMRRRTGNNPNFSPNRGRRNPSPRNNTGRGNNEPGFDNRQNLRDDDPYSRKDRNRNFNGNYDEENDDERQFREYLPRYDDDDDDEEEEDGEEDDERYNDDHPEHRQNSRHRNHFPHPRIRFPNPHESIPDIPWHEHGEEDDPDDGSDEDDPGRRYQRIDDDDDSDYYDDTPPPFEERQKQRTPNEDNNRSPSYEQPRRPIDCSECLAWSPREGRTRYEDDGYQYNRGENRRRIQDPEDYFRGSRNGSANWYLQQKNVKNNENNNNSYHEQQANMTANLTLQGSSNMTRQGRLIQQKYRYNQTELTADNSAQSYASINTVMATVMVIFLTAFAYNILF